VTGGGASERGPRYHRRVLTLPPDAARALATARAEGHDLRYDCREHCHSGRFRLSVRYRVADPLGGEPRDVNLGLLWSEDEAALRALGAELERGALE
jgi:hypothetical protein